MCNFINWKYSKSFDSAEKISVSGYGWKMFNAFDGGRYPISAFIYAMGNGIGQKYEVDPSNWITWLEPEINDYIEHGFCFFRNYKEAVRALKSWKESFPAESWVIERIRYQGGIGEFINDTFLDDRLSVRCALAKRFRIF